MQKPWQVTIEYNKTIDLVYLGFREHTHGTIAFSQAAAEYYGGSTQEDNDGYTIKCKNESELITIARDIAAMSAQPSAAAV